MSNAQFGLDAWRAQLAQLEQPLYAINQGGALGLAFDPAGHSVLAQAPAMTTESLGDPRFAQRFGCRYAYFAGSMANGISSAELVIALGKAGYLASFGAGGLPPVQVEAGIKQIQAALPNGPYAANLIHSPNEKALETGAVELYLQYGVTIIEASAYLDLTEAVVRYRAKGIDAQGIPQNRIIAKVSRREVAERFLRPAPERLLKPLLDSGDISEAQYQRALVIPMADALSVEADSGGHTDNRPLVNLLPSLIALRNQIQGEMNYPEEILIGAGGGIGTPESALAALMMGAAYLVTGSINQACIESGTSDHVRKLLSEAAMADVIMAPASDMFEQGVKLQVLRRGSLFAMRAQKLYDLYQSYNSMEEIPLAERQKLEAQLFKKGLDEVWADCVNFFNQRDPAELKKAESNPKKRMALVFRWYLGQSSHWAKAHTPGREMDYQIWTGPAMGAFNDWVRGSYLEAPQNRLAVKVAEQVLKGTAYLARLRMLELQGVRLPASLAFYHPQ